jgi:hypothetical protein
VIQPRPQHPQSSKPQKAVPFILLGVLVSTDLLAIGALPSNAQSSVHAANSEPVQAAIQNTCSLSSLITPAAPSPVTPQQSVVQSPSVSGLPKLKEEAVGAAELSELVLADNTPIKLKFKEEISSKKVKQSQVIALEVAEAVVVQGVTVIEKGANAKGCVAEVKRARMMGKKGKLSIALTEVQLVSGEVISIHGGDSKEGGTAAVRMALSSIVAPFFLLMAGKEAKYPAGTELTAFVDGDRPLNPSQFMVENAQ